MLSCGVSVGRRSLRELLPHEPLVILRYFGPEANPDAPEIGDAK